MRAATQTKTGTQFTSSNATKCYNNLGPTFIGPVTSTIYTTVLGRWMMIYKEDLDKLREHYGANKLPLIKPAPSPSP